MSFKKVGYWCSVILPILDFIKMFIKDIQYFQDVRQYIEEANRFERDNRPSVGFDVDMSKFDITEVKLNKEKKENGETV